MAGVFPAKVFLDVSFIEPYDATKYYIYRNKKIRCGHIFKQRMHNGE